MQLDSAPFGGQDYTWFSGRVHTRFKVRLGDYKPEQMKRRLASLAQRNGAESFVQYGMMLEQDSTKLAQFLDEMTINVTELLRNPSLFEILFSDLLAGRFPRKDGTEFRVWSAGCSYGAEAYTLAMLLAEKSPLSPFSIRGTDIDLSVLARANSPVFGKRNMVNISEERRKKHFVSPEPSTFLPQGHLRQRVQFSPHDLLGEDYPFERYDLILCRNVLIYFTDEAKDRIYSKFARALKPGGILFVGGTERLPDHAGAGFGLLRPFFYEKTGVVARRAA